MTRWGWLPEVQVVSCKVLGPCVSLFYVNDIGSTGSRDLQYYTRNGNRHL